MSADWYDVEDKQAFREYHSLSDLEADLERAASRGWMAVSVDRVRFWWLFRRPVYQVAYRRINGVRSGA